jgi:hypothetical protein
MSEIITMDHRHWIIGYEYHGPAFWDSDSVLVFDENGLVWMNKKSYQSEQVGFYSISPFVLGGFILNFTVMDNYYTIKNFRQESQEQYGYCLLELFAESALEDDKYRPLKVPFRFYLRPYNPPIG